MSRQNSGTSGLGLYGVNSNSSPSNALADVHHSQANRDNDDEVEYLLGIHDFRGRSEDELSLKKGDHIQVIETDRAFGDGWYIGRNLTTNEAGLFPKVFTTTLILPNRSAVRGGGGGRGGEGPGAAGNKNNNNSSYFRSQLETSTQGELKYDQLMNPELNQASLHDTLTDIDEAISELNGQMAQQPPPQATSSSNSAQHQSNHQHKSSHHSQKSSRSISTVDIQAMQNKPGMPSLENIPEWTPLEVSQYFDVRGYDANVSEQFIHHKITGQILLELELAYLKEIDITSFGTRFEISKDIKQLNSFVKKQRQDSVAMTPSPASIRRQSMSHQFTRSPSRNGGSNPPAVIGNRSSSLRSNNSEDGSEGARPRKPSTSSSSNRQRGASLSSNAEALSPQLNDTTIPENTPVDTATSTTSTASKRTSSYVEDSRRRMHSRNGSFDTIKAEDAISNALQQQQQQQQQEDQSYKFGQYLRKRHSHSGSHGSQIDFEQDKTHKRRSSLLSALMGNGGGMGSQPSSPQQSRNDTDQNDDNEDNDYERVQEFDDDDDESEQNSTPRQDLVGTPYSEDSGYQQQQQQQDRGLDNSDDSPVPLTSEDDDSLSHLRHEKKNSMPDDKPMDVQGQRIRLRQASSTQNLRKPLTKQKTSAFLEGIRTVTAQESAKDSVHSGWMHKRGGIGVGSWKSRYFTLHGTRLSYFQTLSDTKERGLIDITSHRVLPAKENEDKFISLYAASVGAGRHVFKLVPPAPGTKKGVTFTAPKVHYFAVETRQEMREWMGALMKATIDRDHSIPILSSCATPTVSIPKAQELFAEARARDEDLRSKMIAGGLTNMPNANAAAAAAAAAAAGQGSGGAAVKPYANANANNASDPDSPNSSLRSSRTGSSATNSSSLKVTSSATSPKDYTLIPPTHDLRNLTTKTAGLRIVTDLESNQTNG